MVQGPLADSATGATEEVTRDEPDTYFLKMATLVAERGTCVRRRVGCVLVNHRRHVLATGYNGVAAGLPHCIDAPCAGATCPSGSGLDKCEAIHAEQNALLQCRDVYSIDTCYTTLSPCMHCLKLLLNTSCKRIVFAEEYVDDNPKRLWTSSRRLWINDHEPDQVPS